MSEIYISIVVEDDLSEAVIRKLIDCSRQNYAIHRTFVRGGRGNIYKQRVGFNNASKGTPYLIFVDLDRDECAPSLVREWLPQKHHNLIFCVAVREVESWIIASRSRISEFLGIEEHRICSTVDEIQNTKEYLLQLVKKSRNKSLKKDILPRSRSTAKVGPDYNGRLIYFVEKYWDSDAARANSPSLDRTIRVLENFRPA